MERHPGLKIVLPHAGGFLGHYWARMDHAWRARPDCRTVIKKPPTSYLKKFFFRHDHVRPRDAAQLIDKFGAAQVLLGTDYRSKTWARMLPASAAAAHASAQTGRKPLPQMREASTC